MSHKAVPLPVPINQTSILIASTTTIVLTLLCCICCCRICKKCRKNSGSNKWLKKKQKISTGNHRFSHHIQMVNKHKAAIQIDVSDIKIDHNQYENQSNEQLRIHRQFTPDQLGSGSTEITEYGYIINGSNDTILTKTDNIEHTEIVDVDIANDEEVIGDDEEEEEYNNYNLFHHMKVTTQTSVSRLNLYGNKLGPDIPKIVYDSYQTYEMSNNRNDHDDEFIIEGDDDENNMNDVTPISNDNDSMDDGIPNIKNLRVITPAPEMLNTSSEGSDEFIVDGDEQECYETHGYTGELD